MFGFICFILINLTFDHVDFLNTFRKEKQQDVEELKQAAIVESSHSNTNNVAIDAELNPELNEARQEYLRMMAEGLEELNKKDSKKETPSKPAKTSRSKKSSSKINDGVVEEKTKSSSTKSSRKSSKKESE